jgi:hypothetical protein
LRLRIIANAAVSEKGTNKQTNKQTNAKPNRAVRLGAGGCAARRSRTGRCRTASSTSTFTRTNRTFSSTRSGPTPTCAAYLMLQPPDDAATTRRQRGGMRTP